MGKNFENLCNNLQNRVNTEPQFKPNRKYVKLFIKSCDAQGITVHTKNKYLDKVRYISDVVPAKDFKK